MRIDTCEDVPSKQLITPDYKRTFLPFSNPLVRKRSLLLGAQAAPPARSLILTIELNPSHLMSTTNSLPSRELQFG